MKKRIWIGIGLVMVAGVIIVGQWRSAAPPLVNPLDSAAAKIAIPVIAKEPAQTSPAAQKKTASVFEPKTASAGTNALTSVEIDPQHPYRLKNSHKPARELFTSDRAIVLRNALIDSDQPTSGLNIPEHLQSEGDPESYVVQARGRTTDEFRTLLTSAGAEIVSYIPNNAYLVKAKADEIAVIRKSPLVLNAVDYEPYYKLSAALLPGAVKQDRMPPGQPLRIALFPGTKEKALAKIRAVGAIVTKESEFPFGPLVTVIPKPDALAEIARIPEVQLLEIYPRYRLLRDLGRIRVGAVNPGSVNENLHGLSGANVVVGVNGTGVQTNHVEFDNRVLLDLINYATPFEDGNGHETHVAGIIAGNGSAIPGSFTNGSVSDANYAGVAPQAKIYPLSIFPATAEEIVGNHPVIAGVTGAVTDITVTFESAGYQEAPSVFIFDVTPYTTNASGIQLTPGANASYVPVLTDGRVTDFLPLSYGSNYTASNTFVVLSSPWDDFQTITNQARNTNVYIVNNSWSVSVQEYDTTAAIYDAAVRDSMPHWSGEQAINYVFAAGNSGFGGTDGQSGLADSIESPATAKNVITVGAIENLRNISTPAANTNNAFNNVLAESDSDSQVADFSSRGNVGIGLEGEYGRFKPDLVAPGTWVLSASAANHATNRTVIDNTINNSNLRYESGTSMAAPFVSGMLALMQEAFDGSPFNRTNSPALNKALLINSARPAGTQYDYAPRNFINYQGWGVPALSNAIPELSKVKLLESAGGSESATVVLVDQSGLSTNRLRSGQTHNFDVAISGDATNQSLRITLAWTDPPGNPAAGIKLVNDLDLVVSNTVTSDVFIGNFIASGSDFTTAASLSSTNEQERAVSDFVNNVENVFIRGPFTNGAANFRIFVSANRVNVNATGLETNDVAQDYVLVVSTAEGADVTVTHNPSVDSVTNFPTQFLLNGIPVLEQRVGAYSTFQTNTLIGTTNQWNFFVFTNRDFGPVTSVSTNVSGTITNSSTNVITPLATGTNVAFATFFPPNLGRTRNVDADIDVYVTRSTDPPPGGMLTSNNINEAIFTSSKTLRSTNRGGLEVITLDDASVNDVFYIGVKSEDQQGGQYSFLALSTDQQFTMTNADGSFDVPFFTIPSEIPDGNPGAPGGTNMIGIMLVPTNVYNPVFSNSIAHENHADLSVSLIHGATEVFVRNHSQFNQGGGVYSTQTRYFNATLYNPGNTANISGATLADGPGEMGDFVNTDAFGTWLLQVTDDAANHTGSVMGASLRIGDTGQNRNRNQNGNRTTINFDVDPGESFIDFIFVPLTATNLKVSVSGAPATDPGIDLLVAYNQVPPAPFFTNSFTTNINGTNFTVTNISANAAVISLLAPDTATSIIEVKSSTSPALRFGPWFARVVNNTSSRLPLTLIFELEHNLGIGGFDGHDQQLDLDLVDLASTNLTVAPGEFRTVADLEVAVGVEHPRPADLVYELFSPSGTRVLLSENRGDLLKTNFFANFAEGTNTFTSIVTDPTLGTMLHLDQLLPIKAITNQYTNVITPPLLMVSNIVMMAGVHTYPEAIVSPGSSIFLSGSLKTNAGIHHTNWGMALNYVLPFTNNMATNWLTNWPGMMLGAGSVVLNQGDTVFKDLVANEDGVFMVGATNRDYFTVFQDNGGRSDEYVLDIDTACTDGTFNFTIDTFSVTDHYHVYYAGVPLLSVDWPGVGANTSYSLPFGPGTDSFIRLVVNQGGNTNAGTAWALSGVSVSCNTPSATANRALVVGFPTTGPGTGITIASNGATMLSRAITNNPYGYAGNDRLFGIASSKENSTNMLYVVGSAQIAAAGAEKFFMSKLTTSGRVLWTASERGQAAAIVETNTSGGISAATVTCAGTNYSIAPAVNIVDLHSQGSGAAATASIGPNGNVTGITITAAGIDYQRPAIYIDPPAALADDRGSVGYDVAIGSNIVFAVGSSNRTSGDASSIAPIIWAYDTNGCLLWTSDEGSNHINGAYSAIGIRRTNFYTVGVSNNFGTVNSSSAIHSWDFRGNLLATTNYAHISSGTAAPQDMFDDLIVMRNPDRIYAVGTRTNVDLSTDATLVEIDPDSLEALSTTIIDNGANEAGKGVTTDGRDLYVAIQTDPGAQSTTQILRFRVRNYYLPEESLHRFQGEPTWYSSGNYLKTNWTLRITDTRAGGTAPITPRVKFWGINFTYAANGAGFTLINTGRGFTGSILANSPSYFSFDVAPGTSEVTLDIGSDTAISAVVSASGLPSIDDPESHVLVRNGPGSSFVLSVANGFNLRPGRYYLAVEAGLEQAGGSLTVSMSANPPAETPTLIPLLENGVVVSGAISAGPGLSYYSFTVPEGSTGARFDLSTLGDDLNLYLRRSAAQQSLPSLATYDVRSVTSGGSDEAIFLVPDGNSSNALSAGTWFIGVENRSSQPRSFNIRASSYTGTPYEIVPVAGGQLLNTTAPVGNAPARMYRLDVASPQKGILFEVRNLTGDGDLIVRKGASPTVGTHTASSQASGTGDELVVTRTNALDTTLEGEWYFGVINREESVISYSAVAKLPQGGLLLGESPPQLSSIVTSPNAGEAPDFGFDLNVVPGETYQVHYTTNPAGFWFSLTNIVAPASGVIEFVHQRAAENPKLFYRVQQVP